MFVTWALLRAGLTPMARTWPSPPRRRLPRLRRNWRQSEGPASLLPPETAVEPVAPQAPSIQMVSYSPAPQPRASLDGAYFVQIGAYSDLLNAHRVRDAVSGAGPVTVDIRQTAAGELFRVRVGPWASRERSRRRTPHFERFGLF